MAAELPLSRTVIWLMCLGLTPLCGSVLYYVWKSDHPAAAQYANRVSFAAYGLWLVAILVYLYALPH